MLELFYHDVMKIEPNNRDRKKDLTKEKLRSYIYIQLHMIKLQKLRKIGLNFKTDAKTFFK